MIHTPWFPMSVGQTTASLTELVDIFPTVAALAGLPVPDSLDGTDVSALQSNPKVCTFLSRNMFFATARLHSSPTHNRRA